MLKVVYSFALVALSSTAFAAKGSKNIANCFAVNGLSSIQQVRISEKNGVITAFIRTADESKSITVSEDVPAPVDGKKYSLKNDEEADEGKLYLQIGNGNATQDVLLVLSNDPSNVTSLICPK